MGSGGNHLGTERDEERAVGAAEAAPDGAEPLLLAEEADVVLLPEAAELMTDD